MSLAELDAFYRHLPAFSRFLDVADETLYRPLPPGWIIGVADVTDSTGAIRAGRYKAVNMAGAGVIAAVGNAIGSHHFPFAFGGDGASFALPGAFCAIARDSLAAMRRFSEAELDLTLRAAALPIETIRAAGHDVTVARFEVSPALSYAMFAGGGLAFAENRMKTGQLPLAENRDDAPPDLTGLSCRFEPVVSSRGHIVSLIAVPLPGAPPGAFGQLVRDLGAIVQDGTGFEGSPITPMGLRLRWPPRGLGLEEQATRGTRSRVLHRLWLGGYTLMSYVILRFGLKVGGFDPARYRREVQSNSDFRKFSDRLELTLDCSDQVIDRLRRRLDEASAAGVALAGLHLQRDALITCLVRSPMDADHIHFVDGADGGYAEAARILKEKLAAQAKRAA
jgi:hypothetical protein